MANLPPDSVARFICDAALGKIENTKIDLPSSLAYAYEHYGEDDMVTFQVEMAAYEMELPLHEKVKFAKLSGVEDPDMYSYTLGLEYVGTIREEGKNVAQVGEELDQLRKECKSDPEFYKRFMKGFKTALHYDRHHDLEEKIYTKFISYPDSIK